jgi:hypothetical protein
MEEREYWARKGSGADEWTFEMSIWCIYIVPISSAQFIYPPKQNNHPTNPNTKPQTLMYPNSNPLLSLKTHQFLFLKTLPPAL